MAWKGDAWGEQVARTTIGTNYFGTRKMCTHFLPLVRPHGRVVNVSSSAGKLKILNNSPLVSRFESPNLTLEELDTLMNNFIEHVINGTHKENGWPNSCYGVSKVGVNTLTRILIREERKDDIKIYSVCPGYCSTQMSSFKGTRSAAKGAETPLWLALLPENTTVKQSFYLDMTEESW